MGFIIISIIRKTIIVRRISSKTRASSVSISNIFKTTRVIVDIDSVTAAAATGEDEQGTIRIQLSEQDNNAINRLCELGFERDIVIQVYLACDKNEEVAADILFRDM